MAPIDSTSSPRDHAADANPELARKKQRLSEENTSTSLDDTIVIEACEPEDMGTNMENAIQIEDDFNIAMEPYSEDFRVLSATSSPLDEILGYQNLLQQNYYLDHHAYIRFCRALSGHIAKTADESPFWRRHYLEDERGFFEVLAATSWQILIAGDLLEPVVELENNTTRRATHSLLDSLESLCRRIIPFLPDAVRMTISRRDSAQISAKQQPLLSLHYIAVATRVLSPDTPTLHHFQKFDRHLQLDSSVAELRTRFATSGVVPALATVIRLLSGAVREVKDSWFYLQNALVLFQILQGEFGDWEPYPKQEVEDVMEVVNVNIRPAICGKHPRALPDHFHRMVVQFGKQALQTHATFHGVDSACILYEQLIRNPTDAIIPETGDPFSTLDSLWRISGENQHVLSHLLSTSWSLQTIRGFVCSEIMDVRNVGMQFLASQLVEIFNGWRLSAEGFEHPVIQYAVRFLRRNEITGYIFGPESRASLINQSTDIIAFLAATHNYTNAETDIIWRGCSTSVEADFVKASFGVLNGLVPYLDFDQLLYIANKFSQTPIAKLGHDAAQCLEQTIKRLESMAFPATDGADPLALAFTSIRILKHVNTSEPYASTNHLRRVAMIQINRFADANSHSDARREIFNHCMPEILGHSPYATTAVEILSMLVSNSVLPGEAESILAMLPTPSAVQELCAFVEGKREQPCLRADIDGIIVRMDFIVRLMAVTDTNLSTTTQVDLFDYLCGTAAISNDARNCAWEKLVAIARSNDIPSAATGLWKVFLHDHVPLLPAHLATPHLLHLVSAYVKGECAEDGGIKEDFSLLLRLPLWQALVRFATNSPDNAVVHLAVDCVMELLFTFPIETQLPLASVARCHRTFAADYVRTVRGHYDNFCQSQEGAELHAFWMGMNLLTFLLSKSQKCKATHAPRHEPDVLTIGSPGEDRIPFVAQVYGPEVQPRTIPVEANESMKVADFLAALPPVTGTGRSRVIAGGVEITHVPNKSLSEAGVHQAGVVMICPKYTFDLDLNKVLTEPGPVEQEIQLHYRLIEGMLDGPDQIAHRTLMFLHRLNPSADVRAKVASTETTAQELFPPDAQFRTLFSLFVLTRHVHDFARLGVADASFIVKAIRVLTAFVLDETRSFNPTLMLEMLTTLALFLRERPTASHFQTYFEDANALTSRLVELLFKAKDMSSDQLSAPGDTPLRTELAAMAYHTLLQACQIDVGLWNAFTSHENNTKLHMQLLLDDDAGFSCRLAHIIRNLCQDSSMAQDISSFYLRHILSGLPNALDKNFLSETYFDLAVDVLHRDQKAKNDEAGLRKLTQTLLGLLWSYQHTESPRLLIADKGMAGLLRLLVATTSILKSHKKPIDLDGFSVRLFRQLLFPPLDRSEHRALVHEDTRAHAYDLIRSTFALESDYDGLVDSACAATHTSADNDVNPANVRYPGNSEWLRPPSNAAGLTNLGMTCYMNSLLQQLYANLQFRKFILEQPVFDAQKQEILLKLQSLFAQMQSSTELVANTSQLATSLNVQIGVQEDVHTFYTALFSRLEESMPDNDKKLALTRFFTGKSVTQIKGQCGHVSSRAEPFTELSITVKNKASLRDSLDEFVQGEPLEGANKYMCMTCGSDEAGQLVNAMKRTCLDEVPDCLTFCLKRFAFESILDGENKVNDRFEFPAEIDMSLYKRSHLENPSKAHEPDVFELVGVIVHQGSLSYGHYWSYARVPGSSCTDPGAWLYLEDAKTMRCASGIREVQQQCFGGLTWSDGTERPESAYVLFYQRRDYISQAAVVNTVPKHLQLVQPILPRVDVGHEVAQEIEARNNWRLRVAALFDERFSSFVLWLLGRFPSSVASRSSSPDSSDAMDQTDTVTEFDRSDLHNRIGDLISSYMLRVLVADPGCESKLASFMSSAVAVLTAQPSTAGHLLGNICEDPHGFTAIVNSRSPKARARLFELVETCVLRAKEHQREDYYDRLAGIAVAAHSSLLGQTLDFAAGRWAEYLSFAAKFARMGVFETRLVLDCGYLDWIFGILFCRFEMDLRKRHQLLFNFWKTNTIDILPLFDFLYEVLSGHVDLFPDVYRLPHAGEDRIQTENGWSLRQGEIGYLFYEKAMDRERWSMWPLFHAGVRLCPAEGNWRDYAPGKLVGLFSSNKVHPDILRFVETHFATHFEFEEASLEQLLYPALHICLNKNDQSCGALVKSLCKGLVDWHGRERRSLWFLREAYPMAPVSVVDAIPQWAKDFLLARGVQSRQAASLWLFDHLFEPQALTDNPALDASRIRSTRALVKQCHAILKRAYTSEEDRGQYEPMIETMVRARNYLSKVQSIVAQVRANHQTSDEEGSNDGNVSSAAATDISPEIQVECDESRGMLPTLIQFLTELREWEPMSTALPTRTLNIRKSVEFEDDADDDEELEGSEEEFEDGSSELNG